MQSTLLLTAALVFVGPQADGAAPAEQAIILLECSVEVVDEVEVPSKLVGVLMSVEVHEGDEVLADQEVARLDDKRAKIALDMSKKRAENNVNVKYAEAAADVAKIEYEQGVLANKKLFNTIPYIEMRRLELSLKRGTLQIEQADREFVLEGLQKILDEVTFDVHGIKSPIDGIVVAVNKYQGEAVTAGEHVLTVRNIKQLRVQGYLKATEVAHSRIKPGQIVEFYADLLGSALGGDTPPFRGKITYVEPGIDPGSEEYQVWALVNNNEARDLLPGMYGTMKILGAEESVALQTAP